MKKTVLALALALGISAFAQESTGGKGFSKGDVTLAGKVGFSSNKSGEDKTSTFTFAPEGNYFITDNFSLGLSLAYQNTDVKPGDESTSALVVGPQARYYFTPKNDFSLYLELGAGFASAKHEVGAFETKMTGFAVAFGPGINYFVSEHFAIQAGVGILSYTTMKEKDTDYKMDDVDLGWDSTNLNFGLVYKF